MTKRESHEHRGQFQKRFAWILTTLFFVCGCERALESRATPLPVPSETAAKEFVSSFLSEVAEGDWTEVTTLICEAHSLDEELLRETLGVWRAPDPSAGNFQVTLRSAIPLWVDGEPYFRVAVVLADTSGVDLINRSYKVRVKERCIDLSPEPVPNMAEERPDGTHREDDNLVEVDDDDLSE